MRPAAHPSGASRQAQRTKANKANKDLVQAACLMGYLLEHDADVLHESWRDVFSRGPGWRERLLKGWEALAKTFPSENFEHRLKAEFDPVSP